MDERKDKLDAIYIAADWLAYKTESLKARANSLYDCMAILDNDKLDTMLELIYDATEKVKQAWDMGLREDN